MANRKREHFTRAEVVKAYTEAKNLHEVAERLSVSYGTAVALVNEAGISKRRQGYNRPDLPISGRDCRHAREYLGMTRDQFCELSGVGKTALRQFELGKQNVRKGSMEKIMAVFDSRGIIFKGDGTFETQ